jgi:hypothetical protein
MSDFNYGTELETLGTSGYLHSHGVSYVLSPYSEQALFTSQRNSMEISKVDGRVGLTLHNPLNGHPCGTLELTPQDTDLVAANPLVTWQPEYPEVALWKVPEGGGSGM